MGKYFIQIQGLIIGICLIFFRDKIAVYLPKIFEKFPKYQAGMDGFNVKFEMRPVFITILGVIFILMSIGGFWSIWQQNP